MNYATFENLIPAGFFSLQSQPSIFQLVNKQNIHLLLGLLGHRRHITSISVDVIVLKIAQVFWENKEPPT